VYCGKQDLAQTVPAEVLASSRTTLNQMLKFWQTKRIGLWLIDEIALFLEIDKQSYDIYSSGDHATASFVKTEVSADASSGASTIDVDSITGISASDNIGVELDDGTLQWTTVNGAPAGSTITLTDVLTDDVNEDAHVYTYTTKAEKPLELLEARIHLDSDTEYRLNIESRDEYKRLSAKDSSGKAVQIYSDFRLDRLTVFLWPVAESVKDYILMSVRRRIDDADALSDNIALPPEWLLAVTLSLAYWISPKHGVGRKKRLEIKGMADEALASCAMFDQEDASITIEPRTR
jgi:hypothetical protein